MLPQPDLIRCPDAEETGTTNSRHGARLTRFISRASVLLYWLAILFVVPKEVLAAEKTDPALVPSIFSPESAPAHAISHLAGFVL
jgi:hypothetical protein